MNSTPSVLDDLIFRNQIHLRQMKAVHLRELDCEAYDPRTFTRRAAALYKTVFASVKRMNFFDFGDMTNG